MVDIEKSGNELIFLGGLSNKMWLDNGKHYSRNYKQGYRVYDSKGISAAITRSGAGIGGVSGIYLVRLEESDEQ